MPIQKGESKDMSTSEAMHGGWWDLKDNVYNKFLKQNQKINAEKYYQLEVLHNNLQKKHPSLIKCKCVLLFNDNARPHIAWVNQKKITV